MYDDGILFNVVNYDSFRVFCEALRHYGPGIKPPGFYEVKVLFLKKEVENTRSAMKDHIETWTKHGCFILLDGWKDKREMTLINFLVNCPKGFIQKSRNRLAQKRLNDLVFVKYNRALRRRYNLCGNIDPITLCDINKWLTWRIDDQDYRDDEAIFSADDGLTWNDSARAAGVGEPSYRFRSKAYSSSTPRPMLSKSQVQSIKLANEDESEEECAMEKGGTNFKRRIKWR
ncbi:hypothetical protein LWI28_020343 [Acer negundo]|uniref:DUF659 domain-containing protein n=1 Tax=Acer negundo TaxID=4023 RepID=A0AAD5IV18_ACENE|nr:hypothetical protein LWI28_020343 [Acer negundo]